VGGTQLWAFPWYEIYGSVGISILKDRPREKWFLDLFLATGCDPNLRRLVEGRRQLPLEVALVLTASCSKSNALKKKRFNFRLAEFIARDIPDTSTRDGYFYSTYVLYTCIEFFFGDGEGTWYSDEELSGGEELPDEERLDEEEKREQYLFELLTPLINAGADVYGTVEDGDGEARCSLSDFAYELGLGNIWAAALKESGYSLSDVWAESTQRLATIRKLKGASASGVDVDALQVPDASGLRHRGGERDVDSAERG